MRRVLISMVAALVLFGALLSFSGIGTADHIFAKTGTAGRTNLINACFAGGLSAAANTPIMFAHGWITFGWSDLPSEEKRAFNHRSTTFVLLIDGVQQHSAQHNARDPSADTKIKWFVYEYHKGLPAGSYTFTIEFYLDGSLPFVGGDWREAVLVFACDIPATFV